MRFVFEKRVLNVTPVTNPTPMSKSNKIVKTIKLRLNPKYFLARFRESLLFISLGLWGGGNNDSDRLLIAYVHAMGRGWAQAPPYVRGPEDCGGPQRGLGLWGNAQGPGAAP